MKEKENTKKIQLYATSWCYMSRNTKAFLDRHQVAYDYIDIDKDTAGEAFVLKINNESRSVPTLLFPDGSTLTEPSQTELIKKLGLES
jgi:glutaredoxin